MSPVAANGRQTAVRELPVPQWAFSLTANPRRMHRKKVGGRVELHQSNQTSREAVNPSCAPFLGHMYIWALWARLQPISQADPPTAFHKRLLTQSRWRRLNQDGGRPGRGVGGLALRAHPLLYANAPYPPPPVGRCPLLPSTSKARIPKCGPGTSRGARDDSK